MLGQNGLVVKQVSQRICTLSLEGSQIHIKSRIFLVQVRNKSASRALVRLFETLLDPSDVGPVLLELVPQLATKIIELRTSRWCCVCQLGGGRRWSGPSKRGVCVLCCRGCRTNLARDCGNGGGSSKAMLHGGKGEACVVGTGQERLALIVLRLLIGTFFGGRWGRVDVAWNLSE